MSGPVFLDFFAGFGGSSSGLVEAGYELATAYNHWDKAVAVHSANHRAADHVQGDLSGYDMRRLPKHADVLWASPECTWHSPAGGRKRPRAADLDLFGEYVPNDAGERSRATMFDPIRAAEARGFKAVMIENVPEVASWPLFRSWLLMWESLGYSWQIVNVSAAHVYGPGNAPAGQWRDRIYIVLTAKGVRMPRIEPRPPAWCEQCGEVVEARQHWRKPAAPGAPQVGKYRRQYDYVCGANRHARHIVEPYVLPAAGVIDWSDLGIRIGDRESLGMRPLAAATMRRVEVGARMFARPAVVAHGGQTWDAAKPDHRGFGDPSAYYRAWAADGAPLMTRQAGGTGDALSVPPFMTAVNHDDDRRAQTLYRAPLPTRSTKVGDGIVFPPFVSHHYGEQAGSERRNDDADSAPLGAITAGGAHHNLVVPPYLVDFHGTGTANNIAEALAAVSAGGNHHGLTIPPGAFLSRQYGSRGDQSHLNTSVMEPTHPITGAGGNHALVIPERKRPDSQYEGELPFDLADVRFRMLNPTEHLRAQRFWEGYDVSAANKSEATKGAGNAVAVNVAHWIGEQVFEVLS
ncbi:DNA cytosine methyltransferase [Homoserinibacter sp. GY 40078]|uniref:DNA cytosine methyltransferase n=1 Tax=Homoserinibacter sp. GY 40078 TaxID=2603275 RepID=UPI0011CAED9A|nr:DNA cytosine methyltransferase [Homoserinibacter sp. GY 40078]TXK17384.1 DNA cytosine methyltransferase [Homoserinibacter sp. GY 40078]